MWDLALIRTGFNRVDPQANATLYRPLNRLIVKTSKILRVSGLTEVGMPVERICPADDLAEYQIANGDLFHP